MFVCVDIFSFCGGSAVLGAICSGVWAQEKEGENRMIDFVLRRGPRGTRLCCVCIPRRKRPACECRCRRLYETPLRVLVGSSTACQMRAHLPQGARDS
jgi:hypothetical protein